MRLRSRPTVVLTGLAAMVLPTAAVAAAATPASSASSAVVTLVAADPDVTVLRYPGEPLYGLDLGLNVIGGRRAVRIDVVRSSYHNPITATLTLGRGGSATTTPLPKGLVTTFSGLTDFLHMKITDAAGKVVADENQLFCPSSGVRFRPDAPGTSPYPAYCNGGGHPFALGTVYGLQAGWASPVSDQYGKDDRSLDLPDGQYTAVATITPKWAAALKVPAAEATATVHFTVKPYDLPPGGGPTPEPTATATASAAPSQGAGSTSSGSSSSQSLRIMPQSALGSAGDDGLTAQAGTAARVYASASASGHAGAAAVAAGEQAHQSALAGAQAAGRAAELAGTSVTDQVSAQLSAQNVPAANRPDLRALPAFGVTVVNGSDFSQDPNIADRQYLAFAATVWNAGPGPMVVEGHRHPGAPLMDADQYFYDHSGKQVGYAPTGSMQYDPRPGHEHWHFLDFATYRLLDGSKKLVVRSQKEAFCLAPTDPIDLTGPGANFSPGSTGLYSACGTKSAIAIRENLDSGWGDTYGQYLPGQSFDLTDIANGTYYIEVLANPFGHLFETNTGNNQSLRKVILGGKPGARTVSVPPYEGIDAP